MKMDKSTSVFRLFIFSLSFISCTLASAQGWRWTVGQNMGGAGNNGNNEVVGLAPMPDGSNLSIARYPSSGTDYYYLHAGLTGLNNLTHPSFWPTPPQFEDISGKAVVHVNGTEVAVLEERIEQSGQRSLYLNRDDIGPPPVATPNFVHIWEKPIYDETGVEVYGSDLLRDGNDFVALGHVKPDPNQENQDILLLLADDNGNTLWSKIYPTPEKETPINLVKAADGGYLLQVRREAVGTPSALEYWLIKTDAAGNFQWESNLAPNGTDLPTDIVATADGNLILTGIDPANGVDAYIQKIDQTGNFLWRKDVAMQGSTGLNAFVIEDYNGDIVVAATMEVPNSLAADNKDIILIKTDSDGNPIWEKNIGRAAKVETVSDLARMATGGYIMGGHVVIENTAITFALLIRTDANGVIKPGVIKGNVFDDLNLDCSNNAGDLPLENWVVEAYQDSLHHFYADTDASGNYYIQCDTGNYLVSVAVPVPYRDACANPVPVHVAYQDSVLLDFPLQPVIFCPYLTIDHQTNLVRPCDTTTIFVQYCNTGTAGAEDAYVELSLDSIFTFVNASITPSSQSGNLLTIPIGDVPMGECSGFWVDVFVDCEAQLGQVACSEAHIFPDSICLAPHPLWSGAIIEARAVCEGGEVKFNLKNIGGQAMAAPLEYIVIEDAVLLMEGSFELQSNEELLIPQTANGATYHLIAEQEPGAPGGSTQVVAMEGCVGTSGNTPSSGFFNQFSQSDELPFISSVCNLVANSYDPNDKQAFPTGFGDAHNILSDTELEYVIRFQNTGNADALRVILLDSLSAKLDPATIRPGASSHPYEFEMEANGLLRFTFRDINLPPASLDEAASQGFVSFRIAQRKDNPVGTVIENEADIYFDYNLPIRTNEVWHTVHEPLIEVTILSQYEEQPVQIKAYPNPFSEQLYVELPEGTDVSQTEFRLYNLMGQPLRVVKFEGNQLIMNRLDLLAGTYFFSVMAANKPMATGKLIIR